ncbi:MAG: MltA domain-containing protein [Anaeromyxobacter sp.]
MRTASARIVAVAGLLALTACPGAPPTPPPSPARTADLALVELSPDAFPSFSDDLDWAGLDEAIARSEDALARIAAADPGRTFAFGKERVPLKRLQATLARFRELAAARPAPADLDAALRREFRAFRSTGDGTGKMLVTGYYLPELRGSMKREGPFQIPLHAAPDDLVTVRAKDFPALSEDLVGKVEKGRLVPYPTRAEIAGGALAARRAELLWVDSEVDAFFLEVQGSGVVRFPDGTLRTVTYAGNNGHRYESLGAELVRRGAIPREQISMQTIRAWLAAHPEAQRELLDRNPSYVFFRLSDAAIGALGVPVTTDRSVAADPRVFPKGGLAFLESERPVDATPGGPMRPFARFVLDQDSGGAIRTSERLDLFLGHGAYAAEAAGRMKQPGRLTYLLLR